MASSPLFIGSVHVESASTGTSANTAFDGTGTIVTLFTAHSVNGSKVEQVYLRHLGTNVSTVVRFFMDRTGSAGYKLIHEESMAAYTSTILLASVPNFWGAGLVLQPGGRLGITIANAVAAGIMVTAVGGDF